MRSKHLIRRHSLASTLLPVLLPLTGFAQSSSTTPVFRVSDAGFANGAFGFRTTSSVTATGVIQSSSDLMNWNSLQTNTFGSNAVLFSDPATASNAVRFYRVVFQGEQNAPLAILERVTTAVNPDGATIELPDGGSVTVPPGALPNDSQVVMLKTLERAGSIETSTVLAETVYSISFAAPTGSIVPFRLSLPIDTDLAPSPDSEIHLNHFDRSTGEWTPYIFTDGDSDAETSLPAFLVDEGSRRVIATFTPSTRLSLHSLAIKDGDYIITEQFKLTYSKGASTSTERFDFVTKPGTAILRFKADFKQYPKDGPFNGPFTLVTATWASFPFVLSQEFLAAGFDNVYTFITTEDYQGPEDGFVWNGVSNTTRPADSRLPRTLSNISHLVMHDYGNANKYNRPFKAHEVLRAVLLKQTKEFAPFYIDDSGAIFQIARLTDVVWHAGGINNKASVGIEMQPINVNGGFSDATIDAAAKLSAYLLRVLDLPFDPDIEMAVRNREPNEKKRFAMQESIVKVLFSADMKEKYCEKTQEYKNRLAEVGTEVVQQETRHATTLPQFARHVSIVGHGEIQGLSASECGYRADPRLFDWNYFIRHVKYWLYDQPELQARSFGPLIDCSARTSEGDNLAGGRIYWQIGEVPIKISQTAPVLSVKAGELQILPGTDKAGKLVKNVFSKVYVAQGGIVEWDLSLDNQLLCGSFFLGRGAVLRLKAPPDTPVEALISSERVLQIDGLVDGRAVPGERRLPVTVWFTLGAGPYCRVPSIVSRGGNSWNVTKPGGNGGDVLISNTHPEAKLMFFGRGSHVPGDRFPIPYSQLTKTDYFNYGPATLSVASGTFLAPGIITSGGAGAGGGDTPVIDTGTGKEVLRMIGGNGGFIRVNSGTAELEFSEECQFLSGAGADVARLSPIEVLTIAYERRIPSSETLPSGGNGGRGRISFGTVDGGNGGNGGSAGDIQIFGRAPSLETGPSQSYTVTLLNQSFTAPIVKAPINLYKFKANGKIALRVSAIGGSGGPAGGDKTTGFKGFHGWAGPEGNIQLFSSPE